MNKKIAVIISPNWRDYAKKYLDDCLDSLIKQDWTGECKYFFIDNESTEESYAFFKGAIESKLPATSSKEIIRISHNAGFAESNNQAMRLAVEQGFDYLVLFNIDTIVEPNVLSELVKVAEGEERIGIVQPRLMLWPEKGKINSLGNATHFLGFGYCEGYGDYVASYKLQATREIFYPSGAAFLIKAEVLKQISYFDEEFWMYAEDQDLGWRVWLAGFKCVLAPEVVVYHKYEFSRSIAKYYWMDRNRIIVILKNYHFLTLLMILPPLFFMELGLLLFAWKGGWLKEKFKIYKYFLKLANCRYILKARQDSQKLRKIKDRAIAGMISGRIWYQEVDDWKLRAVNPVFELYWKIIRKLIIW